MGTKFTGEESDGGPGTPSSAYLRVNRRRTDLMPTIPSPRDAVLPSTGRSSSAKAFTRSPGRTYSMSRLDQLSQPRKRQPSELSTLAEQQSLQPLGASSMSRSMSHLAPAGTKSLKRSDNSRSMGTLPGAVPTSRPTRAERLRRRARDQQYHQQQQQGKPKSVTPLPSLPTKKYSIPTLTFEFFFFFFFSHHTYPYTKVAQKRHRRSLFLFQSCMKLCLFEGI